MAYFIRNNYAVLVYVYVWINCRGYFVCVVCVWFDSRVYLYTVMIKTHLLVYPGALLHCVLYSRDCDCSVVVVVVY